MQVCTDEHLLASSAGNATELCATVAATQSVV